MGRQKLRCNHVGGNGNRFIRGRRGAEEEASGMLGPDGRAACRLARGPGATTALRLGTSVTSTQGRPRSSANPGLRDATPLALMGATVGRVVWVWTGTLAWTGTGAARVGIGIGIAIGIENEEEHRV